MMHRNEDYRDDLQKKEGDDASFAPEEKDDSQALGMKGENPLAEEEAYKVDDSASD